MAQESDLGSYTSGDSGLNEDLTSKTSLSGDDNFQDDTGAFNDDQPLGSGRAAGFSQGATIRVYQLRSAGIFNFGDGSDGNVVISGNTTLTADMYYENLVVNSGVTLNPGGYRIFVAETCRIIGTIARNGNAGGNGEDNGGSGGGGSAGAALGDGYLKGSPAGGAGGARGTGNGGAVTATPNNLGTATAGNGGNGGADAIPNPGGNGSGASTYTVSNVKLISNWHLLTLLDIDSTGATAKFTPAASGGGGGGGAGGNSGGGGGGASAGGLIAIYAKRIIIESTGIISVNGANGGNGGNAASTSGGGGGGGGSNAGVIILVYNSLTNSGALNVTTAGTGGTGGAGSGGGSAGINGGNGVAGVIYQFEISL